MLGPAERGWIPYGLERTNFGRLGAFFTLARFEFDPLAILQCPVSVRVDVRMMDEEVIAAALGLDESKSLLVVKPLHCTCFHYCLLCGVPAPNSLPFASGSDLFGDNEITAFLSEKPRNETVSLLGSSGIGYSDESRQAITWKIRRERCHRTAGTFRLRSRPSFGRASEDASPLFSSS